MTGERPLSRHLTREVSPEPCRWSRISEMSFAFCETHSDYHRTFATPPTICPTAQAMTGQPVSGSDPEKVLADALYDADEDYNGLHSVGERAAGILAAMPEYTIIRRSELAALRAVAKAARPHSESITVRVDALKTAFARLDALARLNPEPEK